MFIFKNLVSNEFFPKELPPCFSTSQIGDKLSDEKLNELGKADFDKIKKSTPILFSGYKSESSRRRFAVPNIIGYIKLAKLISDNSERIFNILEKSKTASLTAPIKEYPDSSEPYRKAVNSFRESEMEIEKLYYGNRYELYLDISSFFDSIYTHSIAWAVEGKIKARSDTQNALFGNQLDTLVRAINRNQTNGILIGNSLSRIISEIILCSVDEQIQSDLPEIEYKRYVDDYHFFTKDVVKIPNTLSVVRKHLGFYELNINENKIQTNESPFIYGKPWIESVREYIHLDPLVFLNHLIIEYKKHKDVTIFRYGLQIILLNKYTKENWTIMESKILNLLVSFPSLADIIIKILLQNKEYIHTRTLKAIIYNIIDRAFVLSLDQELIWMAWYIKVLKVDIKEDYVLKILNTYNTLAVIIILDYIKEHKNKMFKGDRVKKWRKEAVERMNSYGDKIMESEYWLLAYEGTRNQWFNFDDSQFKKVNINNDFKFLLENKICFYLNDYNYTLEENKNKMYATKEDLIAQLNEIRKLINKSERTDDVSLEILKHEYTEFENMMDSYGY